ncbi:GNAT family N-acetyltransferase [Lactobacillus sp. S2-2]|uniref:GNAT family N-acetyltransferase n=1 Tax=Lactobacillus sp. S2-2 TaxID=2692917 RepID=UPI001F20A423|nr:GNAT family N-acetyltransferase [Lactobacillus sp. S2-2]MCF6515414.1 GNAT family N-acetyltransferase [Lactobacillus sp. S2-2]
MSRIYVRKATKTDLPAIKNIIDNAKQYLGEQGINQWQRSYPDSKVIEADVDDGIAYVLEVDGNVAGSASLHLGIDTDYLNIEDGDWINGTEAHYSAIHRVAVLSDYRGQGLSGKFLSNLLSISAFQGFKDVRIDTHPDNVGMQHVILSNGFEKRGIVHMNQSTAPGTERFAYQQILN